MNKKSLAVSAICVLLVVSLFSCGDSGKTGSSVSGVIQSIDGNRITVLSLSRASVPGVITESADESKDTSPSGPVEKEPDGIGDPRAQRDGNNGQTAVEKEPDGVGDPRLSGNNVGAGTVTVEVTAGTPVFSVSDGSAESSISFSDLRTGDYVKIALGSNGKTIKITKYTGGVPDGNR
ncbi:MAG: hypothetical protein IJU75_05090 [Clostridia bacterium]|nr:hypothetical protein [Clostridia bacterium]